MSSAVYDESLLGLPVEIGRIDRELGRLWEESGDTKTRASLINLAIYTEEASALKTNTELIANIAGEHACRALLVYAHSSANESRARAWISAHCHLAGKGERQICSEQITFVLEGDTTSALPNVVFSHLDSDLPLCLWWQSAFREPVDEEFWSWVDRLLFDSQTWEQPGKQLAIVRQIGTLSKGRTVLCDLNWARLLSSRFALASFFDNTSALKHLRDIRKVEITHAPGAKTTAVLLLGWLAAQLEWSLQELMGNRFFLDAKGEQIGFVLQEAPGACISRCEFQAEGANFSLTRESGSEFFRAEIAGPDVPPTQQMLSAGREKITDILTMELGRGGRHPLYLKAVSAILPLFD